MFFFYSDIYIFLLKSFHILLKDWKRTTYYLQPGSLREDQEKYAAILEENSPVPNISAGKI